MTVDTSAPLGVANAALLQGNRKILTVTIHPTTGTNALTGCTIETLIAAKRLRRCWAQAQIVGGAQAATIVVGWGAAAGTIDSIFATITIADLSAMSLTTAVAGVVVDAGADGVPDNQDVASGKLLMFSTTKAGSATFIAGTLYIEYTDSDT